MAAAASLSKRTDGKSAEAFRTISEVAATLDVPQHVLRFWESKFSQVRPLKRGGGRRYYRPEDVELLQTIRGLLYDDGYTIKGVQKLLRDGSLKQKSGSAPSDRRMPPKKRRWLRPRPLKPNPTRSFRLNSGKNYKACSMNSSSLRVCSNARSTNVRAVLSLFAQVGCG
jgi:DNA-binding transcriptional MerR regulator